MLAEGISGIGNPAAEAAAPATSSANANASEVAETLPWEPEGTGTSGASGEHSDLPAGQPDPATPAETGTSQIVVATAPDASAALAAAPAASAGNDVAAGAGLEEAATGAGSNAAAAGPLGISYHSTAPAAVANAATQMGATAQQQLRMRPR